MKIKYLILIVALVSLISSCKYFKEHRLFSKDVDTLLDIGDMTEQIEIDSSLIKIETDQEQPYNEQKAYYSDNNYFVIIGSFQNSHYANKYAERYRALGYNTQVLTANNGFYRVSAGSYSTYQEGINSLRSIKAAEPVRAWLYNRN